MNNSSTQLPVVSFVITCKGRVYHLKHTLPTILGQSTSLLFEIIVVDYGCPQKCFEYCCAFDLHSLIALRVTDNTNHFNISRARNCGAVLARGMILAFVDADMALHPTWLESVTKPIMQGNAGLGVVCQNYQSGWDRAGSCVVLSRVFHEVRGFDEAMQGWGVEDQDFYARCAKNTSVSRFSSSLLHPIRHGEIERTQHYQTKSILSSSTDNSLYLKQRNEQVNPGGYGLCEREVYVGCRNTFVPCSTRATQRRVGRKLRRRC